MNGFESGAEGIWALPGLAELQDECEGGDPEICVAILDGPVDLGHPCFAGAQIETAGDSGGEGGSEHGTHVASVLLGQPGSAVPGIAPSCRGLILPVYRQEADGSLAPCQQMDLARSLDQALAAGAHVANVSGGELTRGGEADPFLEQAIRSCAESGVLVLAATGNEGCECLHVPAALPSVLAVGAADRHGRPLAFSNWGGPLSEQGILAPGEAVLGAVPGGAVLRKSGTSFATPVVSGVAALLLSLQKRAGRRPDGLAVRQAILYSAAPCEPATGPDCERFLAGRLDIAGARGLLGLAGPVPFRRKVAQPFNTRLEKEMNMGQETSGTMGAEPSASGVAPASAEQAGVSPACACQGVEAAETAGVAPAEVEASCAARPAGPSAGAVTTETVTPSERSVRPSQVFCGRDTNHVFALGQLSYDFGCEARLDYFVQRVGNESNAFNPVEMAAYLNAPGDIHKSDANALIWTLNIDATPVYAIEPIDQFAVMTYLSLTDILVDQAQASSDVMAVAGQLNGERRLYNGTVVPVINPVTRGLLNWNSKILINSLLGDQPASGDALTAYQFQSDGILQFLQRIYYDLRNLGVTPQDRAKNYSATNAFQLKQVFADAYKAGLSLDTIGVERSPICRPDSDCWDVKLTFFNPAERLTQARKVYRYTVDVSDVIPVTVGDLRTWYVY